MSNVSCRFCGAGLSHTFCDLGMSPISNAYIKADDLQAMERFYPLHVYVCNECFLVQLAEFQSPDEIFSEDYAYFSSYSDSWLAHSRGYVDAVTNRFGYGAESLVMELASNDGYLLQYFVEKGVPVQGIEPASNVAAVAEEKGVPTLVRFFGVELARELVADGKRPDLLLGNNVLAHVPDINDFVGGMKIVLKEDGVITMEFPHLLQLMRHNQFDTIYHEHFSYLSFTTVERIFASHGLTLFDVEELWTHGGSIRIYAGHAEDAGKTVSPRVAEMKRQEEAFGLYELPVYLAFQPKVQATKRKLLTFILEAREQGKTISGYGAPAKGNTLLNYCGLGTDLIDFTVDRSPHKQGLYLPGTHIPIRHPEAVMLHKPDYLLILPWNIRDEVMDQMTAIRRWGGKFVVPIPEVEILD